MLIFQDILQLLQQSQSTAVIVFAILGLCVGSFLNVVIHRTPLMMYRQWEIECRQTLHPNEPFELPPVITLSQPASRCPNCGHKIRWFENMPILSWLVLKGKCRGCQAAIGWRYPVVELLTAILSVVVIVKFGVTFQGVSALIFTWVLIALTGIDFDTQLLPDRFTLPLAALGLLVNTQSVFVSPVQAIWGYVIGFLTLWVVYQLYLFFFKKEGMGYGDFKLLAALGAWLGPLMLPLIILLSSLIGSVIGIILMKKAGESKPFAFGPYIAMAGMVALLFGQDIMTWYMATLTIQD